MPPYQQPYYPPAPAPVQYVQRPAYQAPVTRAKTIKTMLIVGLFMLTGTLGMAGLSALVSLAHDSLTYSSLEPYKTSRYQIDIPVGWQVGESKEKSDYTQIEFYDGMVADELIDRLTSLQVSISIGSYSDMANAETNVDQLGVEAQAALQHRLEDYVKSLNCLPSRYTIRKEARLADRDLISADTSLTCRTEKAEQLQLYARYDVNRKGDLMIEIMHTSAETWAQNQTVIQRSMKSLRVII